MMGIDSRTIKKLGLRSATTRNSILRSLGENPEFQADGSVLHKPLA
jgi:hypothetical protein